MAGLAEPGLFDQRAW